MMFSVYCTTCRQCWHCQTLICISKSKLCKARSIMWVWAIWKISSIGCCTAKVRYKETPSGIHSASQACTYQRNVHAQRPQTWAWSKTSCVRTLSRHASGKFSRLCLYLSMKAGGIIILSLCLSVYFVTVEFTPMICYFFASTTVI